MIIRAKGYQPYFTKSLIILVDQEGISSFEILKKTNWNKIDELIKLLKIYWINLLINHKKIYKILRIFNKFNKIERR
jgi:hypothetical protein